MAVAAKSTINEPIVGRLERPKQAPCDGVRLLIELFVVVAVVLLVDGAMRRRSLGSAGASGAGGKRTGLWTGGYCNTAKRREVSGWVEVKSAG